MSGVTDLEIHQRFNAMADELEQLMASGPSFVGSAALETACRTLRGVAMAIYEHSLVEAEPNIQ